MSQYEITVEDKTDDGHHRFKVKMKTDKTGEKEVRYIVVGKNPLWVYREEDYKKVEGNPGTDDEGEGM